VQHWSTEHNRPYYHNAQALESIWERPSAGLVRELDNIAQLRAEAAAAVAASVREPAVLSLTIFLFLPLGLALLSLFGLYHYRKRHAPHLLDDDARTNARDRAANRRGRQTKSTFRPRWKMAQAGGAGGRSANS
jgi:hypothetical protein